MRIVARVAGMTPLYWPFNLTVILFWKRWMWRAMIAGDDSTTASFVRH